MYEITVIENLPHTVQMFHVAVDDEHVEQVAEELHDNERMAVHANQIKCFTIIAEYQRYNDVHHYQQPQSFVTWKRGQA
jgi:hypothetical protein